MNVNTHSSGCEKSAQTLCKAVWTCEWSPELLCLVISGQTDMLYTWFFHWLIYFRMSSTIVNLGTYWLHVTRRHTASYSLGAMTTQTGNKYWAVVECFVLADVNFSFPYVSTKSAHLRTRYTSQKKGKNPIMRHPHPLKKHDSLKCEVSMINNQKVLFTIHLPLWGSNVNVFADRAASGLHIRTDPLRRYIAVPYFFP